MHFGMPSEDGGVKQDTTALEWFEWSFCGSCSQSLDLAPSPELYRGAWVTRTDAHT